LCIRTWPAGIQPLIGVLARNLTERRHAAHGRWIPPARPLDRRIDFPTYTSAPRPCGRAVLKCRKPGDAALGGCTKFCSTWLMPSSSREDEIEVVCTRQPLADHRQLLQAGTVAFQARAGALLDVPTTPTPLAATRTCCQCHIVVVATRWKLMIHSQGPGRECPRPCEIRTRRESTQTVSPAVALAHRIQAKQEHHRAAGDPSQYPTARLRRGDVALEVRVRGGVSQASSTVDHDGPDQRPVEAG